MTVAIRSDRTDLRSYAGERGVPFQYPAEESHDGEPRSLVDSWRFLLSFALIALAVLIARAWGLIA